MTYNGTNTSLFLVQIFGCSFNGVRSTISSTRFHFEPYNNLVRRFFLPFLALDASLNGYLNIIYLFCLFLLRVDIELQMVDSEIYLSASCPRNTVLYHTKKLHILFKLNQLQIASFPVHSSATP